MKVGIGNENLFLPAVRVRTFTDNFTSVGKLAQKFNLTVTKDYVYLSKKVPPPTHAKVVGRRTAQNLYDAGDGRRADIAAP